MYSVTRLLLYTFFGKIVNPHKFMRRVCVANVPRARHARAFTLQSSSTSYVSMPRISVSE